MKTRSLCSDARFTNALEACLQRQEIEHLRNARISSPTACKLLGKLFEISSVKRASPSRYLEATKFLYKFTGHYLNLKR
jgi:hypothetical protein